MFPHMNPISIDSRQIRAFANHLRNAGNVQAFDFCSRSEGFIYPRRDSEGVLDYFFFACAHQFGFWTLDGDRWAAPMVARIDGQDLKGSDFLFRAATRALQRDARVLSPASLATLDDDQLDALFHDDSGSNPLPLWPEHRDLVRGYAQWFVRRGVDPAGLLRQIATESRPLRALLKTLESIPGYAEDPLAKKAMLLAITLENRPEHFLALSDPESAVPIIDYHLQRSALRTGLVRIDDPVLRQRLEDRRLLSSDEEELIRAATYDAMARLMAESGLSSAALDWFFFQNRTRCPETSEPDCPACPVQALCARQTTLFQPVYRTTAY